MHSLIRRCTMLLAAVAAVLGPSSSLAVVLDDYSVGPYSITGPVTNVVQSGLDPTHVVGGQRQFSVSSQNNLTFDTTNHQMIFASGPTSPGYFDLTYGASTPLGVDLTAEGHDRFRFTFSQVTASSAFLASFGVTSAQASNNFSIDLGTLGNAIRALAGTGGILEVPYLKNLNDVSQLYFYVGRLPAGGSITLDSFVTAPRPIPGDYNRDGDVDQADYQEWRRFAGKSITGSVFLSADGNRDGRVDAADYVIWRKQVGAGGAASGAFAVVPEHATIQVLLVAICIMLAARPQRRVAFRLVQQL